MNFPSSFIMNSATNSKRAVVVMLFLALAASSARADVCVWRDPERTMQKIFPQARDYRTVTVKMTPDRIANIEKSLGAKLDDSEKNEFNFYRITGITNGKPGTIGTIIALAGKGEYGAIEVVIGVDRDGKILGAYIQRSRERATSALESPKFLKQFVGKTKDSGFEVGKDITPVSPNAEQSSRVVAFVVRKMVIFYDVLERGQA